MAPDIELLAGNAFKLDPYDHGRLFKGLDPGGLYFRQQHGADLSEAAALDLEKLKEAHKSADLAAIDTALEEINAAWQGASQEMYQATQGAEGAQPGPDAGAAGGDPQAGADSDVSDVEFEEVDDKK